MPLLFADSFDHYTTATIGSKYDAQNNTEIVAGAGRRLTNALRLNNISDYIQKSLGDQQNIILGIAAKFTSNINLYFDFLDSDTVQIRVLVSPYKINLYRGTSTLLFSQSISLFLDEWNYIEIAAIVSESGQLYVYLNGVVITGYLGDTTITANEYTNVAKISVSGSAVYLDDLYIKNDNYSEYPPLGDIRVDALLPNAVGDFETASQWTPSYGGVNYEMVDDPPSVAPCPDGDATYNYETDESHNDIFNFADLSLSSETVHGVRVSCYIKRDDVPERTMCFMCCLPGGLLFNSPDFIVPTSYSFLSYVWDENPDTLAPWTVEEINSAQFGYKMTS